MILLRNSITWKVKDHESTIDLIFTTFKLENAVKKCQIRKDLQLELDHLSIATKINLSLIQVLVIKRRVWKTIDSRKIRRLTIKTDSELFLNSLNLKQQIDEYIDTFLNEINRIANHEVLWSKSLTKARTFWNKECTKTICSFKKVRKKLDRNNNQTTYEHWKKTATDKEKITRKIKTFYFCNMIHDAANSSAKVWKSVK